MSPVAPARMKALVFREKGSLGALHADLVEVPLPRPGLEALVQVRAAAINPSDPKNVLGKMSQTTLPRIPGRDFAGVVVEGPGPWTGKAVLGTGGDLGFVRDGSHAEFLVVPVEALAEKPRDLSFEQAATIGVAYLAAWSAMVTSGAVSREDTVLVLGATGAVGSAAVKIARHRGARRIIGALRNDSERPRTAGIPADDWINLEKAPLPEGLLAVTGGKGADLVLNVVGGPTVEPANQCLAHRGRHIVIASIEPRVTFNLVDFYHREARLIGVDTLKLSFAESRAILDEILPLVRSGVLTPPDLESVDLEAAPAAYQRVLDGTASKKQVIRFPG